MKEDKICFECGEKADHNHHVIPRSLGGTKTIPLCEKCHKAVHSIGSSISMKRLMSGVARKERATTIELCHRVFLNKGRTPSRVLAKKYGVSHMCIQRIRKGEGTVVQAYYDMRKIFCRTSGFSAKS